MNTTTELILPLEQAVVIAAYQNLLVDRINEGPLDPGEKETPWQDYLEEARYLLKETEENYQGVHGHPTIKVLTEN